MDGVPADLTIKGYANLNTREINYDMWVAPEVTSSLPVIVAWMVNPVTGIAAFALDKMIHSARVISEIEFKISGTFDEPVVTEKGRKSKEVALPVDKSSTPNESENAPKQTSEGEKSPDTQGEPNKPESNANQTAAQGEAKGGNP
jgi:hypothetical protein